MIFAAGLGTRLGEAGRRTPKALLVVGGATMLEHVAGRLVAAGADRLIVNVHHHARRIEAFVRSHDLGAEVVISHEIERPLETGGGLLHARALFRRDAPIFLHNVDILSDADLRAMRAAMAGSAALAVLAVNERPTSRHLLFDEAGLFGRRDDRDGTRIEARPPRGPTRQCAFAGIHVISPETLDLITESGAFSILDPYLRLAAAGHSILPFPIGAAQWSDVGSPDRLEAARRAMLKPKPVSGSSPGTDPEPGA